jgi:hypothetical protein
VATFITTDVAQMRRCRAAQLHGHTVREAFQTDSERVPAAGYVHAIRPDSTSSPLRWTIVIEGEKTARRQNLGTVGPAAIEAATSARCKTSAVYVGGF